MDRLRLTRPGDGADEGFANGGWMAPPAPNGGRSGLKLGAGFSGSAVAVADASTGAGAVAGMIGIDGGTAGCAAAAGTCPAGRGTVGNRGVTGETCAFASGRASSTTAGCSVCLSFGFGAASYSWLGGSSNATDVSTVFNLCPAVSSETSWSSALLPSGIPPVRRRCRSAMATSSSTELECVFFSCTPNSGRRSRMAPGLISSSRASSLIRIFFIEETACNSLRCGTSNRRPARRS
jgi:hypothetical protein